MSDSYAMEIHCISCRRLIDSLPGRRIKENWNAASWYPDPYSGSPRAWRHCPGKETDGKTVYKRPLKRPCRKPEAPKELENLYIFENCKPPAGHGDSLQNSALRTYIFCPLLTVSVPEGVPEPFSKTGLEKMVRGQKPNPHPQAHPPRSFSNYYYIDYQCFVCFTFV